LVAISVLSAATNRVLNHQEKQHLIDAALHRLQTLRRRRGNLGGMADIA
jgi:hypothetical protein